MDRGTYKQNKRAHTEPANSFNSSLRLRQVQQVNLHEVHVIDSQKYTLYRVIYLSQIEALYYLYFEKRSRQKDNTLYFEKKKTVIRKGIPYMGKYPYMGVPGIRPPNIFVFVRGVKCFLLKGEGRILINEKAAVRSNASCPHLF